MMSGIRAVGLCVAAVFAFCALAAGSAFAVEFHNLPHYGKCEALAGGKYKTAGCTKLGKTAEEMKFEWHPLATTVGFKSVKEKETGEAVLEGASGSTISCETEKSKEGEYGPGDQVKNTRGEFTKCKAFGVPCESEGAGEGNINTKLLKGEPGIVEKEAKEEKNVDGADLKGQTSEFLAEFSCSSAAVLVKGGVVVKAQADKGTSKTSGELTNKMNSKVEVEFVAEKPGKQVPELWYPNGGGITHNEAEHLAGINEHLESSTNGGVTFEPSGQTLTTVQESVGKVKVELRQCEKTISCPN